MDDVSMLNHRINLLEEMCLGVSGATTELYNTDPITGKSAISLRVDLLATQLSSVESSLPSLRRCHDLMVKLRPLLLVRRDSMTGILGRIDWIVSNRDAIQRQMESLSSLSHLSSSLDSDRLEDVDDMDARLAGLEISLASLRRESDVQKEELDELLNIYESSMSVVSEVCRQWEKVSRQT